MSIEYRDAELPADYAGIAAVLTAERSPGSPVSADDLINEDAVRDPRLYRAVFVAEEAGIIVAVATIGHDPMAHRTGKYLIDIRVHPERWGIGIGKGLYHVLLDHLATLEPSPSGEYELQTQVWGTITRALQFVRDRGFVETWQRVDSVLDVRQFSMAPYDGLEERVASLGVRITTYADLASDANRVTKLHALNETLWRDVPYGEQATTPDQVQFEREVIGSPDFIPEACFIAVHGDDYVGFCSVIRGDGYYNTDMTGVRSEWRRRHIGLLLKLHSIRYAMEHGGIELQTVNDAVNTAMLTLNMRLGFVRQGANLRFVKRLKK